MPQKKNRLDVDYMEHIFKSPRIFNKIAWFFEARVLWFKCFWVRNSKYIFIYIWSGSSKDIFALLENIFSIHVEKIFE